MSCDRLDTRRSLLGFLTGVPVALRSCGAIAQQPNLLVLRSYFSPGTRSHNAAQYFAGEATEKANGKFIVPVDAVHSTFRPFKQIAEASSLAHYYAPMGANLEPIFRLSALPMLVASFDEAETLLRIARPYYSATLAHYDQILLAADPWQPGALWSKQPIQSAADIDGSVFGLEEYADVAGWGATVERLWGNVPQVMKAYAWTRAMGADGIRQAADISVIANNYMEKRLLEIDGVGKSHPHLKQYRLEMTRMSLADLKEKTGVGTLDVQNRMVDFGVDAYWLSHEPWVVPEPFTPEAGEMYGKEDLDYWIDVIAHIAAEARTRPEIVKRAPHNQAIAQLKGDWLENPLLWAMTWRAYLRKHRQKSVPNGRAAGT
jgi:hypothetical protein